MTGRDGAAEPGASAGSAIGEPGPDGGQATGTAFEGGRVVPVYALTGGRTRSANPATAELPLECLVTAGDQPDDDLQAEHRQIVLLADRPVSVVEIGAALELPIGVVRVLVGDLAAAGHLVVHPPPTVTAGPAGPPPELLARLLEGLRAR